MTLKDLEGTRSLTILAQMLQETEDEFTVYLDNDEVIVSDENDSIVLDIIPELEIEGLLTMVVPPNIKVERV